MTKNHKTDTSQNCTVRLPIRFDTLGLNPGGLDEALEAARRRVLGASAFICLWRWEVVNVRDGGLQWLSLPHHKIYTASFTVTVVYHHWIDNLFHSSCIVSCEILSSPPVDWLPRLSLMSSRWSWAAPSVHCVWVQYSVVLIMHLLLYPFQSSSSQGCGISSCSWLFPQHHIIPLRLSRLYQKGTTVL